jgi:hypothetical protein
MPEARQDEELSEKEGLALGGIDWGDGPYDGLGNLTSGLSK